MTCISGFYYCLPRCEHYTISLSWNKAAQADYYEIEYGTMPLKLANRYSKPSTWYSCGKTNNTSYKMSAPKTNVYYWVRVRYVAADGRYSEYCYTSSICMSTGWCSSCRRII